MIQESRPGRKWAAFNLRWMAAVAALALISVAGWIVLRHRQTQDEYIRTVSARLSTVLQVGLHDHIHCAVFRKYPKDPRPSRMWPPKWGRNTPGWFHWRRPAYRMNTALFWHNSAAARDGIMCTW
jgi:hypothetical protein